MEEKAKWCFWRAKLYLKKIFFGIPDEKWVKFSINTACCEWWKKFCLVSERISLALRALWINRNSCLPSAGKKKSLKCLLVILAVLQTGPFFVDILHVMPHMCGTLQHWIWEKRIGFEFLCDSTFYVFIVVNWEKSQSMENVWTDGFLCLGRKKVSIFVPSSLLVLSHKGKTGLYIFGIKKTDLFAAAI